MQAGCRLDSLKEIDNLNGLDVNDWIILCLFPCIADLY